MDTAMNLIDRYLELYLQHMDSGQGPHRSDNLARQGVIDHMQSQMEPIPADSQLPWTRPTPPEPKPEPWYLLSDPLWATIAYNPLPQHNPPPLEQPAPQNEGEGVEKSCPPGTKYDNQKLRYDLLPMGPVDEVVAVLTFGASKYAPDNWKAVPDAPNRYFAAAMRHLSAWKQGEKNDSGVGGSGLNHLAHAACCLLFLLHFDKADE